MTNDMSGFFVNEQKCLSNAVLQSCLREQLLATWGIVPLVRRLVQNNALAVQQIVRVELHQCPEAQGIVHYTLSVFCIDGACFHDEFQGSGLNVLHTTFALYDRRRDGAVEHLHLLH